MKERTCERIGPDGEATAYVGAQVDTQPGVRRSEEIGEGNALRANGKRAERVSARATVAKDARALTASRTSPERVERRANVRFSGLAKTPALFFSVYSFAIRVVRIRSRLLSSPRASVAALTYSHASDVVACLTRAYRIH